MNCEFLPVEYLSYLFLLLKLWPLISLYMNRVKDPVGTSMTSHVPDFY